MRSEIVTRCGHLHTRSLIQWGLFVFFFSRGRSNGLCQGCGGAEVELRQRNMLLAARAHLLSTTAVDREHSGYFFCFVFGFFSTRQSLRTHKFMQIFVRKKNAAQCFRWCSAGFQDESSKETRRSLQRYLQIVVTKTSNGHLRHVTKHEVGAKKWEKLFRNYYNLLILLTVISIWAFCFLSSCFFLFLTMVRCTQQHGNTNITHWIKN